VSCSKNSRVWHTAPRVWASFRSKSG